MLAAFDSLHNTESIGTSQLSREQMYNEITFKFCKFAGRKKKFAGDQQEKTHGRDKQRHCPESAPPPPISIHTSTRPLSFLYLALSLDQGLVISHSCLGDLGFIGQRAMWPQAQRVCHQRCSLPLNSSKPWPVQTSMIAPSSAPRVDYGRLYPGLYAHETHFQGEWKASPFFLPFPFPLILLFRLLFLSGNFFPWPFPPISLILLYWQNHRPLKQPWHLLERKKNTSSGLFCFTFVQKRFPIEQWEPGLCNLYIHFNPSKNQQGPHQSRAFINL